MGACVICSSFQSRLRKGRLCKECFNKNKKSKVTLNKNDHVITMDNSDIEINKSILNDRSVDSLIKKNMLQKKAHNEEITQLLRDQVDYLKNEIIHKNTLIESLMFELHNNKNDVSLNDYHSTIQSDNNSTSMSYEVSSIKNINTPTISNEHQWNVANSPSGTKPHLRTNISNTIPLSNKYSSLYNIEKDYNDVESNGDTQLHDSYSPAPIKENPRNNRKPLVNKLALNDNLHIPSKSKRVPGASNYANIAKDGRKICIIGDSIIQRIKIKDINDNLNNATAFKKVFPGGTAEEIEFYANKILEKQDIDRVVLNIGSNNVQSKHTSINTEIDIVNTILKTVAVCHRNGVNEVFVSGITCRRGNQEKIDKINGYLRNGTRGMNYIFIDNANIKADKHLWDDLHLNTDGLKVLENNFLGALNSDIFMH